MKTLNNNLITVALLLATIGPAFAQTPIPYNITATSTLAVPADGIFRATTFNVATGATLTFTRNELRSPVQIIATGDVTIDGTINVDGEVGQVQRGGEGGPGGFDGGAVQSPGGTGGGHGFGPGAGFGGLDGCCFCSLDVKWPSGGSFATAGVTPDGPNKPARTYGTKLLIPLVGGSGGGGAVSRGGGGGGGAILISSATRITLAGSILARGGDGFGCLGNGSGGAVRLVAPVVSGTGTINVSGGGNGGIGRTRIDLNDPNGLGLVFTPAGSAAIGSFLVATPATLPRLDITSAAGTAIAEGSTNSVSVILPFNSPTAQTVTVKATNFVGTIPIRVVVTPESTGVAVAVDSTITIAAGTTSGTATVNVTIPTNTVVRINAWTR